MILVEVQEKKGHFFFYVYFVFFWVRKPEVIDHMRELIDISNIFVF